MSINRQFNMQDVKINLEEYETVEQVVQDCKTRKITSSSFYDMQNDYEYEREFSCVGSYQEAVDLLKSGYQPAVDEIKKNMRANLSGQIKRVTFSKNVVGFAPIVPLALQGVPNSMLSSSSKMMKAKVIDIYYDITASSSTKEKEFINAGKKILSAILELEMQGYRFNLYAIQTYYRNGSADMLKIKVKSANQPLDLKRVSYPLTHPSFFRVIGFDWYSKTPKGQYRTGYGQSLSYNFSKERLKTMFKEMFGNNAVYFACTEIMSGNDEYIKSVILSKK